MIVRSSSAARLRSGREGVDAVSQTMRAWRPGAPMLAPSHRRPNRAAQQEAIEFEGVVAETLRDGPFRLQLDAGRAVLAYAAGRMGAVLGQHGENVPTLFTLCIAHFATRDELVGPSLKCGGRRRRSAASA